MAASDGLTVTLLGRGGHGSRPHSTIDPVVMAAATVMRLQTIVSREVDPRDVAVVTVGSIHAGLKNNIIPAEAKLELSLRYPDDEARARVLEKVERVVRAEALASGAEEEPVIAIDHTLPPTINDVHATARLILAFDAAFGEGTVIDPGMFTGSEDVSWFAREAGVPLVFWFWGGVDPQAYADAAAAGTLERDIPTNHSPFFAPVLQPTLDRGVDALVVAAKEFLAPESRALRTQAGRDPGASVARAPCPSRPGVPNVRRTCSSVRVSSSAVVSRVASPRSQRRVATRFRPVQHSSA